MYTHVFVLFTVGVCGIESMYNNYAYTHLLQKYSWTLSVKMHGKFHLCQPCHCLVIW